MPLIAILSLLPFFSAAGYLLARTWPFYRHLAGAAQHGRFESLDGLRGYLALAVLIHHAAAMHEYLSTGTWRVGLAPLAVLGPLAVSLFFMITGFIFWTRALRSRRHVSLLPHLRGRFLRIVPLYLFSALLMLALIVAQYHAALHPNTLAFWTGLACLLLGCGAVPLLSIDGFDPGDLNASVLWTLVSEWRFYLALPLLAFLARRLSFYTLLAAFVLACVLAQRVLISPAMFLCGMLVAELLHRFGPQRWAAGKLGTILCLGAVVTVLTRGHAWGHDGYNVPDFLLLAFLLFCLVNGSTLLGLVTSPAARVLGAMSYSIYLLHGIVLYVARPLLARGVVASRPGALYWLLSALVGLVVIALGALTYRWIEYPFIAWSHRLDRRERSQMAAAPALQTV